VKRTNESGRDAGAAAVEFALVSVLLLTLLFGIIQYGYFFFQSTAAEHAAREGARQAAVGIDDCGAWVDLVQRQGGSADVTGATASAAASRGTIIDVTVTWRRQDFGFPFIPFLSGGDQTEVASTRAERLGAVTTGCS
jgi:Flp pilus assembly protein TadG